MGGRIAQHVALAAPDRVERLVLVATTAGIADDDERAARRADDERLAAFADGATIEQFADRWTAQPLFAGTPPDGRAHLARGPAAQRPARAGRRPARHRHRRDGAAVGAPADADHAGDGPRRRRGPEVRRARRAPGGRAAATRARGRAAGRARPAARGARGGCRRRSRARRPSPGWAGTAIAPCSTGSTVSSSANSSSVPSPQAAVVFRAAAQWTAAAMPSGPSKVEAR